MPFIEVITRCYKRPNMLAENKASLDRQTFEDWEQSLLIDDDGMGLDAANAQLAGFVPSGDYVWILDDDDMASDVHLFDDVHTLIGTTGADMVMVKMDHGPRGVLPAPWKHEPIPGLIGSSAAFIHKDLWEKCCGWWARPGYMSDGHFMVECFNNAERVVWHDTIGSKVQRISLGEPE